MFTTLRINLVSMYGKVVIPTDGSERAHIGVEEGLKVAKNLKIPVVAVYVISHSSYAPSYMGYDMEDVDTGAYQVLRDSMKKQGENVLKKVRIEAEEMGVKIKTKMVEGTPYEEIIKLADKEDIIYISSQGRSGISSLLLGSTTDRVIKHTDSTVAVVKPKE